MDAETPRGDVSPEVDAAVAGDDLPSSGLFSFYDRLRERVADAIEERSGALGPRVASALLLVPDVFVLLARLAVDRQVPRSTRALLASAVAYFVLPVDVLPELALGPGGYVDDLVLTVAVLAHAFGRDIEPIAARHWSGSETLRDVLGDVLGSARALLGTSVYARVVEQLRRRGVELEPGTGES